ncbi:hypothetical protein [Egicoccus halophilus]|uniref:Uncharacterized protein n=1 Tax=Egicoccus halophilus TaxID=1670830 RepID=A0A8J3AB47_9ACTN|nr:hypothetical protein [Egicoccus halophilus]GGI03795.1 hypothetical protein GCM10011354_05830 [Egicoccus halophilus]
MGEVVATVVLVLVVAVLAGVVWRSLQRSADVERRALDEDPDPFRDLRR